MTTTPHIAAYGANIIVKIDKAARDQKKQITEFLIIPSQFEYMRYNLQFGEIVSIGHDCDRAELKVGDYALFHHRIESEDRCLLHKFENGDQLRWVNTITYDNSVQYFGTVSKDLKTITPAREYVFCKEIPEEVIAAAEGYESIDIPGQQPVRAKKQGLLYVPAAVLTKEIEESPFKNVIIEIVPDAEHELNKGETITIEAFAAYPLNIMGVDYELVMRNFIIAKHTA
jgi:hypothetical protein